MNQFLSLMKILRSLQTAGISHKNIFKKVHQLLKLRATLKELSRDVIASIFKLP